MGNEGKRSEESGSEVRLRVGAGSGQKRRGKSGHEKLIGPPVALERGGKDRSGFDGRLKRALRGELEQDRLGEARRADGVFVRAEHAAAARRGVRARGLTRTARRRFVRLASGARRVE